jgi:hypothetical protein
MACEHRFKLKILFDKYKSRKKLFRFDTFLQCEECQFVARKDHFDIDVELFWEVDVWKLAMYEVCMNYGSDILPAWHYNAAVSQIQETLEEYMRESWATIWEDVIEPLKPKETEDGVVDNNSDNDIPDSDDTTSGKIIIE